MAPVHVLAFGDSVTFGYGGTGTGWVELLQKQSGYQIINSGYPGETSDEALTRLPTAIIQAALSEVIIIMHGGNDWVGIFRRPPCEKSCTAQSQIDRYDQVRDNLKKMGEQVRKAGKRVVFATYWYSLKPVCPQYNQDQYYLYQQHLALLNEKIVEAATDLGAHVIRTDDMNSMTLDTGNWFDCLHPNMRGYREIAGRIMDDQSHWRPKYLPASFFPLPGPIIPSFEGVEDGGNAPKY